MFQLAVRWTVILPGILWLLMPPVCICGLVSRLQARGELAAAQRAADEFPAKHDGTHAPWCPAVKNSKPYQPAPSQPDPEPPFAALADLAVEPSLATRQSDRLWSAPAHAFLPHIHFLLCGHWRN